MAALAALEELCDAYDNRGFRKADHVRALFQQLRARTLDLDAVRALLKERIFPELVRCAHVMLYNEVRHGGRPFAALEDAAAAEGEGRTELCVYDTIAAMLRNVLPPIEGVKRKTAFERAEQSVVWNTGRG